jgi:hypothetical protein
VGKNLDNALASFRQADNQLHNGKGNAMTILQRMVSLGVQGREGDALSRAIDKALDVTIDVQPQLLPGPTLDGNLQEPMQTEGSVT